MESNWNQAVEADSDIPQISESGSWFWRIMNKGEHVALQVSDKLLKPLTEAKYLNADNVSRYRCIMRIFFENYEKLKYWLYLEEVYEEMLKDPFWSEYKIEQCQQDLTMLTEWKNLNTIQDTRRVSSIEEFKNKKYRYQMSEYSVEIERLVIRLENLFIEGASLEPTLLERIRRNMERFPEMAGKDKNEVYTWWTDLNNDFMRLNQNYQDYMRELNSVKAEEMMKTTEFLVFKDRLIEYLRSFVRSLQVNAAFIEQCLKNTDRQVLRCLLEKIIQYELLIPRIDVEVKEDLIADKVYGRWQSLEEWFTGTDGKDSEAAKVFDTTNEIIRKITRYAARISEMSNAGANRREEYHKVAVMFSKCKNIFEAHRLAAVVFGIEKPLHLKGLPWRQTESINSGVFEEEPYIVTVTPRIRTYKEKAKRSGIVDRSKEKEEMWLATIQRLEEERRLLKSYIQDNRLEFAKLPEIEPHVRDVFLTWLSKALENKSLQGKTEDGQVYRVEKSDTEEICILKSSDGNLQMPAYVIVFEKNE